jgi:hypothetical protein
MGLRQTLVAIKGGLGNQLFQLAAALYRTSGDFSDIVLDDSYFAQDSRHGGLRLQYLFPTAGFNLARGGRFPRSHAIFQTDSEPTIFIESLNSIHLPVVLSGYFQNYRYMLPTVQLMRKSLRWSVIDLFRNRAGLGCDLHYDVQLISLHWRGGDYRRPENRSSLGLVSLDKLYEATLRLLSFIERKGQRGVVVCFSDELDVFQSAPFAWKSGSELSRTFDPNVEVADFCAMLSSDYILCGNSTFSIWAAYLSPFVKCYFVPDPWSIDGRIKTIDLLSKDGKSYSSGLF